MNRNPEIRIQNSDPSSATAIYSRLVSNNNIKNEDVNIVKNSRKYFQSAGPVRSPGNNVSTDFSSMKYFLHLGPVPQGNHRSQINKTDSYHTYSSLSNGEKNSVNEIKNLSTRSVNSLNLSKEKLAEDPGVDVTLKENQCFPKICQKGLNDDFDSSTIQPDVKMSLKINPTVSSASQKNTLSGFCSGKLIKNRYQILQEIGSGSFGQVFRAFDTRTGMFCAIKCIPDISNFKQIAEKEISMLIYLMQHDKDENSSILHLTDHAILNDYTFLVFDLLSVNLYQLIYRNNYRGFSPILVRKLVLGILRCLDCLHRNKIIHCDLKPENILLERPGYTNIKVIDFGSSCFVGTNTYHYIQSRFYRAPEVIFGDNIGPEIDIWSLGCILVELLIGTPVFPGENEQDQVACLIEVLGLPPPNIMQRVRRQHRFFTASGEPRYLIDRMESNSPEERRVPYHHSQIGRADPGMLNLEILLCNSLGPDLVHPLMLDFIIRCLMWDPVKRLTAHEALHHPWILNIDKS